MWFGTLNVKTISTTGGLLNIQIISQTILLYQTEGAVNAKIYGLSSKTSKSTQFTHLHMIGTMETASILSHDHELPINPEPGLAEILYLCEDPPGFWTNEKLKSKFPRIHLDYSPVFNVPLPDEGYDCTPRLTKTIESIVDRHQDNHNIVVVSHQSSIDSIFMGLGCDSAYVGQATISIFREEEPQSGQFKCTKKAHKGHLSRENQKNLRGCYSRDDDIKK
ncbi:hypothetical protein M3Y97_01058700 [Aphelenchoides bicaudatus]|nr:hypothetical protein M3Y97_01058700 [Aphelenchoides bicaudatus]